MKFKIIYKPSFVLETSEFNLIGLDAEEYPHLPQIEEENVFKIPTDLLKAMIRQTSFAVSTSETRPILTGVNWKVENNELICIATDSHRLALRKAKIEINSMQIIMLSFLEKV